MSDCPTCGRRIKRPYDQKKYEINVEIVYEEDENVHACKPMMDLNRLRDLQGRPHIHLFRDFDESDWTLMTGIKRLGYDCTKVSRCPYCNEEL